MKLAKHIILSLAGTILLFVSTNVAAQGSTVVMQQGDTMWIDICSQPSGTLVDNGGVFGNYSDDFNGYVVLRAFAGATIAVSGTYQTEECCDWLRFSSRTGQLAPDMRGTGTVNVSCEEMMIIEFHSDGSATDIGFVLNWNTLDASTGDTISSICSWPVSNLTITNTTAHSLGFSWNCAYSGSSDTEVRYRQEGQPNWQTVYISSSLRSYTLTGLNGGQRYTIYVGQGGPAVMGTTCCMDSLTARTYCGGTSLTYTEGFEGYAEGSMPSCWLRVTNFDDEETTPQIVAAQHHGGQRSIMVSSGANTTPTHFGLIVTQPITAGVTNPYITFRVLASHTGTKAIVGLCDSAGNDYNQYNFTPYDTIEMYDEGVWHEYSLQLPMGSWTGKKRVAIKMLQSMQDERARRLYIDDMGVANCWVDGLNIVNVVDMQYSLTWVQHGCTQVAVDVRRAGGGGLHITPGSASSPQALTLQYSSDYYITVTPICCGGEGLAQQIHLRTPPAPFSGSHFCLDNNDLSTLSFVDCYDVYAFSPSGIHLRRGGDNYAFMSTQAIANLAGKEVAIRLHGYYCEVIVGTMNGVGDTASFVPLDTINTDYYRQRFIHTTIPTSSTGSRVAVKFRDNDISIFSLEVGTCLVDSLRYTHRRGTSITLAWKSNGPTDSILVEYGPEGFSQGSGSTVVFVGQRRGTITGLNPNTTYDFIVSRPCTGTVCGTSRLRVGTADQDYPMPYCEDFSSVDWWNEHTWRGWDGFNNYPRWSWNNVDNQVRRTLELSSFGFDWGYYSSVILPDVMIENGAVMSFYATCMAPQGKLLIGSYLYDGVYEDIFVYDTIDLVGNGQRQHYTLRLPNTDTVMDGRIWIRFYHNSEYHSYQCYFDEMHISKVAYGDASPVFISYDTVTLSLNNLIGTFNATVTVENDNYTASHICSGGTTGFGQLDSGTLYYYYVQPMAGLGNGCRSYAGSFITNANGSGSSYQPCYSFDDLLSYEIPTDWVSSPSGTTVTIDGHLSIASGAWVATSPSSSFSNLAFRFDATGDSLILGTLPATATSLAQFQPIDTVAPSTTWHHYERRLPGSIPNDSRLCFLAPNSSAMIDNVNILGCPIVNFEVNGTTLTCTTDDGSTGYWLWIRDTSGADEREEYVDQNPYRIQSLLLNTLYDIEYRCPAESDSACVPTASISTGIFTPLPYCVVFENYDHPVSIPANWTLVRSTEGSVFSLDSWGPSMQLWSADGRWTYAILPLFETSTALSVNFKFYSWDDNAMEIGVLNSGTDTSTFIRLKKFYRDWQEMTLDFSTYIGKHIAIRTRGDARIFRIQADSIPYINYRLKDANTVEVCRSENVPFWLHYYDVNGYGMDSTLRIDQNSYNIVVPETWINDIRVSASSDSSFQNCIQEIGVQLSDKVDLSYCVDYWWDWYLKRYSSVTWHSPGEEYLSEENDNNVFFFNVNNISELKEILVLPEPNIDSVRHASLTFTMKSPISYDFMEIGVMTDATDTASFTPVDTAWYSNAYGGWGKYYVSFSNYTGDGRWVAFRHTNGWCTTCGDCCMHMYIDSLKLDGCYAASGATATLERWNTVLINSTNTEASSFYVEYGPEGFWQGSGTVVRIDSVPTRLNLPSNSNYDFYFRCDSIGNTCMPVQHVHTLSSPLEAPSCINFDTCTTSNIPDSWTSYNSAIGINNTVSHTSNNSLELPSGLRSYIVTPDFNIDNLRQVAVSLWFKATDENQKLVVGTMSDPADLNTFYPLRTFTPTTPGSWERAMVDFSNAPLSAHFIAFRARGSRTSSTGSIYIDDIHVDTCAAFGMSVYTLSDGAITFKWSQVGQPDINITMQEGGVTTATYSTSNGLIDPDSAMVTISPLQPLVSYTFLFSSSCGIPTSGYCNMTNYDTTTIVTPAPGAGCINPTDLNSPHAVFFSGTYSHPYATAGAINYGSYNADSRHTVCYDTNYRDPRTGGMLRTIPEGYTSSLRLGNWSSNSYSPEAEGVIYGLLVDTADFQLILLRYAAVLQDPMHAPKDQPRFRLEVLDSSFNLIDSACTSADFVADQSLGWNVANDNVLWKDWTSVGIDLSAYANQQVYIRLTTFDCNEGSHYGYAYFTLECMRKKFETTACGSIDSNTFTAPAGFNYRWYNNLSPSTTISTEQSITVASADITYFCDLSKLDNHNCSFTLSAYGGTRYPMASFDTTMVMSDCNFYVNFTNTSSVSADGVNPIPGEGCESAYWDFGNGQTSTSYHASTVYNLPGTYTVMLISGIANDACKDTAFLSLTLNIPEGVLPMDTTYGTICSNQFYNFYGENLNTNGMHLHSVVNAGSCDSIHILYLTVNPTSSSDTIASACDTYTWRDTTFTTTRWMPTFFQRTLNTGIPNTYGCDSTVTLNLTLYSHHDETLTDTIIQNSLPYSVAGTNVTLSDLNIVNTQYATFDSIYALTTYEGCDSALDVSLLVWLNSSSTHNITICRNLLPLIFNGDTITSDSATVDRTYMTPTTHGADSTIYLHLTINDNPDTTIYDTIVENQLPYTFRGRTFYGTTDTTMMLAATTGCDTTTAYHLHVWPNQHIRLEQNVCDDTMPLVWDGYTFSATDSVTFTLPDQHGADSIITLVLYVHPTYDVNDTHIICPSQRFIYEGVDYGGPIEFDSPHFSIFACDSLVHVVLMPRDTSYHLSPLYHTAHNSDGWQPLDTIVLGCAPDTIYMRDTTVGAIDWRWTFITSADTTVYTDSTAVHIFPDTVQNAVLQLIITSDAGCIDTLAQPVYIFLSPQAEFDWNPVVPAIDNPEVTFHNTSTPADSLTWLWNIPRQAGGTDYDTSTAFEPSYHWGQEGDNMEGEYDVQLIAYWEQLYLTPLGDSISHTCTDTATHTVTITNDFLNFPNLVTPNGDGKNDTWRVVNLLEYGNYPINELWIYNQWGVEVYHVRDIRKDSDFWDPNKTASPDGTYYYRFTARGQYGIVKRNGVIEVLRK